MHGSPATDGALGSPPERSSSLLARRSFLVLAAGTGAALIAGCGTSDPEGSTSSPDDAVRAAVAEAETALIAQYQGVITAFPDLGASLVAILEQHRAHLAAVTPGQGAAEMAPQISPSTTSAPKGSAVDALQFLADAERAASQQRREACVLAADPELTRMLAFIAASEASHVPALAQVPA